MISAIKWFWYYTIISVVFASCEKTEDPIPEQTPLKFSEVKENGIGGCMDYYMIPGCAWAVLNEEGIMSGVEGNIFSGSEKKIDITNHFQIGSLGKSLTSLMAAKCIEDGHLNWDSKLFSVIPEWKENARKEYEDLTLGDLLSHRTKLHPLNKHETHIDKRTGKLVYDDMPNFTGTDFERRRAFCRYALTLKPLDVEGLNYGNSGYSLAACMMEKVTGKTWEELAINLATEMGMDLGFGRPNRFDPMQPWGHQRINGNNLEPVSPDEARIYNDPILAPAGNIHVNIIDFSKFVKQFMAGLKKRDGYVSAKNFLYLLSGKEKYAMGWYNDFETDSIFYHYGSEGTFYCHMMIFANLNSAIIIFTNAPGVDDTLNFINDARNYLKYRYIYSYNKMKIGFSLISETAKEVNFSMNY